MEEETARQNGSLPLNKNHKMSGDKRWDILREYHFASVVILTYQPQFSQIQYVVCDVSAKKQKQKRLFAFVLLYKVARLG